MKKILMLLLALIFAAPAWAADNAGAAAPTPAASAEPAAQPAQKQKAKKAKKKKVKKQAAKALQAPAAAAGCTFPCSLQQCPPGSIATCRQRLCGALC